MSQPDELETPTRTLPPSPTLDNSSSTGDPPAGSGIERRKFPSSRLDHVFNFQIVVFEVYFLFSNLHRRNYDDIFPKGGGYTLSSS